MTTRKTNLILTLAALLSLTTATLAQAEPVLPQVIFISPTSIPGQIESVGLVSSPTFMIVANSMHPGVSVTSYRTLLKPAILPEGGYVNTRDSYEANLTDLVPFDDESWTEWQLWPGGAFQVAVSYSDLAQYDDQQVLIQYLVAVQIMTADGVVSIEREYGHQIANFRISNVSPSLRIFHPLLGVFAGTGTEFQSGLDLLGGVDGLFTWEADVSEYGGTLASYQWGWDLTDPDDPNDPGWAVPPGLGEANRQAGPIPFASGVHTLTVKVLDTAANETRWRLVMDFVPVPDPSMQRLVLLVDDVFDHNSNAWQDENGVPRDNDIYRDEFWLDVLDGSGGVAGFDPSTDVIDTQNGTISIRDVVMYRSLVWTARWVSAPNSAIGSQFRPVSFVCGYDQQKYVWLGSYQEQVGNLLLAGSRAANAFLPESPYMLPVIFDSQEGSISGYASVGGTTVRVGFGQTALGEPVYPQMYTHRNLGLASLDVFSPNASYYTPDGQLMRNHRTNTCAPQKGLALDPDFAANHMPGGAVFADTIWTDTVIDWQDQDPDWADDLTHFYIWSNDEFYDIDVVGRDTPVTPQDCDGDLCVEPLLRAISRYDWNRQQHLDADPTDVWPQDYYQTGEIDDFCGDLALNAGQTSARTNDQVTAFVTHKFEDQKPSQVGDVVMGFDPYRFDHEQMKNALRWVLGEHFGLTMNP